MDGLPDPRPANGCGKDQLQGQEDPRRRSLLVRRRAAALGCALILGSAMVAGSALSAAGDITTVAGTGFAGDSGDGGAATSAQLRSPVGVDAVAGGGFLIADTFNHRIRKVDASGSIAAVAGTGTAGYSGDGGAATSAQLSEPTDVATDAAGNVFIADAGNHRIRKINSSGVISTLAGTGTAGSSGDGGPAVDAALNTPAGLTFDPSGNLFIAEYGGYRVRKISTAGIITTVAGTGTAGDTGDGGPATSARVHQPADVAVDSSGSFFIADYGNRKVRKVNGSGVISTVAGTGTPGDSGDGGPATAAKLNTPTGVAVDPSGNLFISDPGSHRVRKVNAAGTISAAAGTGNLGYSGDGGPATAAQLSSPRRVALAASGDLLIADRNNHAIRKVEGIGAPAAPTLTSTSPGSPANDRAPRVIGSARSDSTVTVYTNSTCTSAVAASGTAAAFASPGLSVSVADNSTTSFYATATSAAGAVSPCSSSSVTYVEDSAAPAPPSITSSPGASGSDRTPAWGFSGEGGATFECKLARGTTVISDFAPCASPKSHDLSSQPDGTYTFSVRAKDAAGNVGSATTDNYTLDSSAPAEPTLTAWPGSVGRSRTPAWGFTGDPGAFFDCKLTRGATVISDFAPCTSPKNWDLAGQPDGTYTFHVRAVTYPPPMELPKYSAITTDAYTLDTTAPDAPTIGSSPGALGRAKTPTWGFSGEAGATLECKLARGATVVSDFAACTSPKTYDLSGEPDGAYTLSVRATDAAGNVGAVAADTYTLDTVASPPALVSSPGPTGRGTAPAWGFSSEAGATFECRLSRGATVISAFSSCTSPKSYDLSSQPDGTYTFSVRATDPAGNVSAETGQSYALDTAGDAPTIRSSPGPVGRDATPEWGFSGEAGATLECRLARGALVTSDFAPCTSPKRYELAAEPDGTYTFSVRALDAAGNRSGAATDAYTLDTHAAAPEITHSPRKDDASPAWSFSGEPGASFECGLERGSKVVSRFAACTSPRRYDLADEPDGTYTFTVRATDPAGNLSAPISDDHPLERAPEREPAKEPPGPGADDSPPDPPPLPTSPDPPGTASEEATDEPGKKTTAAGAREGRPSGGGRRTEVAPSRGSPSAPRRLLAGDDEPTRAKVVRALRKIARAAAVVAEKSTFPVGLLFLAVGFVFAQDRIDRRDPKLRLAPVFRDPDLEFPPPS